MKREMLVSVIIPTYNRADFIPECIASIRRQAHQPLQIIVVDDGSKDNTQHVVNRLGGDIRYLYQENQGPAAARNAGLKVADGEIIAFLDVDDLWPPDTLACQLPCFESDPRLRIVWGQTQLVIMKGGSTDDSPGFEAVQQPWHATLLGSALFRRCVFQELGQFDCSLTMADDLDWFLRAREQRANTVLLDRVTLFYRLHKTNLTRDASSKRQDLLRAIKQSLDRRRSDQNANSAGAFQPFGNRVSQNRQAE